MVFKRLKLAFVSLLFSFFLNIFFVKRIVICSSLKDIITLQREHGESLGFSFETFDSTSGVFVKRVKPGGVAARDGRLRVGDRIIEVQKSCMYIFVCNY